MSFADECMGAEDDVIRKMDSLATDCGTKLFQAADKAKHREDVEEGKKSL